MGKYGKISEVKTKRKLIPQGIMFSEYYFYLIAYIDRKDDVRPVKKIPYRLDRIKDYEVIEERFNVNKTPKVEEGKIRKNTLFMHLDNMQHVEFIYKGDSLEALEDKLPEAKIKTIEEGKYLVRTDGNSRGLKFWILSHGDAIEVLKPLAFRNEIAETVKNLYKVYGGEK